MQQEIERWVIPISSNGSPIHAWEDISSSGKSKANTSVSHSPNTPPLFRGNPRACFQRRKTPQWSVEGIAAAAGAGEENA